MNKSHLRRGSLVLMAIMAATVIGCFWWFDWNSSQIQMPGASSEGSAQRSSWQMSGSTAHPRGPASIMEQKKAAVVAKNSQQKNTTVPSGNSPVEITKGVLLNEEVSNPSPDGIRKRTTIHQTDFKYPLLRTEEQIVTASDGSETVIKTRTMVADHVTVGLRHGFTESQLQEWLGQYQLSIRKRIPNTSFYLVALPDADIATYNNTLKLFATSDQSPVAFAEPDYVQQVNRNPIVLASPAPAPDDTDFSDQWNLHNTGQTGGSPGADINILPAWGISTGSHDVVVAVLDTGIDLTHPDLAANLWVNEDEVAGDNLDNDGNGFIDDRNGYNFVTDTGPPIDGHSHGTHTAGTIGAVGHNGLGISGIAQQVKIMALKFLADSGSGADSDAIAALAYATANGAMLTSNSWGGGDYSQAMEQTIQMASAANVGCVIAAGNDGTDNDIIPVYPACYDSPNIIVVAATDHNDSMAWFSCYGKTTVHLAAPGVDVLSTVPGASYGYNSGTSMAAPHVSGVAALMRSANPGMSFAAIKSALLAQSRPVASLSGKLITGGVVDAGQSLPLAGSPFPVMVASTLDDSGDNGTVGNNDGILGPGETAALSVSLRNLGGQDVQNLQGTLALQNTSSQISILSSTAGFGTLETGAQKNNDQQPFLIQVDSAQPTPIEVPLVLTLTDAQNQTWIRNLTLHIYRTSIVSGKVTRLDGTTAIPNAIVNLAGSIPGTATANAQGEYSVSVVDGTYAITASAPNYITSAPLSLTVPPSADNINFSLGFSSLALNPTQIQATLQEDSSLNTSLILSNPGDQVLDWQAFEIITLPSDNTGPTNTPPPALTSSTSLLASHFPASLRSGERTAEEAPAARLKVPSRTTAFDNNTAVVSSLPFSDSFEDGSYNLWFESYNKSTREIVTDPASPHGSNNFHFRLDSEEDHLTGIHQFFSEGAQPGHVSFHVRTSARDKASGYVVLGDIDGGYLLDFIWFFANTNGRFYINDDVGGNQSVAYEADRWYQIEFRNINWHAKTFDYAVDGVLIQSGIPFRNPDEVDECACAFIYNYQNGVDTWWDQFAFSLDALDWLTVSPNSGSIQPGDNSTLTVNFDANNILAGTYRGKLQIISNDPQQPEHFLPVEMTVTPAPNNPPVANNALISTTEDARRIVNLSGTDPDSDELEYRITRLPQRGQLFQVFNNQPDVPITHVPTPVTSASHQVIYVAPPNSHGTNYADFQFTVHDGRVPSMPATVTLNITAIADAPVATPDSYSIQPGQTLPLLNVLSNDFSADLKTLNITQITQPGNNAGTVTNNGGNTLSFTPSPSFVSGSTSFTYTISDNNLTATGTVTITAGPLSDSQWPTFGANAQRTHSCSSEVLLPSNSLNQRWQQPLQYTPTQPVLGNEKAYFTMHEDGEDELISALNLYTGNTVWTQSEPASESINSPLLQGSNIYFTRTNAYSDSFITTLNENTGSLFSSYTFPGIPSEIGKHLLFANNRVHLTGGDGAKLYAVDPGSSNAPFITQLPHNQTGTPTFANNLILLTTYGTIRAYDRDIGILRWSFQPDPMVNEGTAIIAWQAGRAFIILNGKLHAVHTLQAPSLAWSSSTDGHLFAPMIAGNRVYAAHTSQEVRAYDTASGNLIATYPILAQITEQPIVSQDVLIVPTSTDTRVIRLSDGHLAQSLPATGYIAVGNETVLVTNPISRQASAFGYDPVLSFSPDGGASFTPVTVQVSTPFADATIHYTTDGSLPSENSPILAPGNSVHFLQSSTLRAFAIRHGLAGPTKTSLYTITDANSNHLPDWWETHYGSQRPGSPASLNPSDNYDQDQYSDLEEFILGTNPNKADHLQLLISQDASGNATLSWPSQTGRLYTIFSSTSLQASDWSVEPTAKNLLGTGSTLEWDDPSSTPPTRKFYHLNVRLQGSSLVTDD